MRIFNQKLVSKFRRLENAGISMRLRLLFFLLILVLTMSAGIVVILLVTGTFTAGIKESRQLLENELNHTSLDISDRFGQISVEAVEFSRLLSQKTEQNLREQDITFAMLADHPDKIEALVSDLFEETNYFLQKSNCSGAFFILDTTVNTSLKNSELSRAGLYLKNMEPNVISATAPSFTILRGFPSIGRSNSIDLHTQWSMEFNVKNADYFYQPIEMMKKDKNLPLSKAYLWSDSLTFPGTSEEVMLCTIPLVDNENNVYGVCGFDISAMLFKLSYMPTNSPYSRMFFMLAPLKDNSVEISRSLVAGGYSIKDISKENRVLKIKDGKSSFTTYAGNSDNIYIGLQQATQLYPKGSPYADQNWITAVLVPKEDVVDSITRINIILICLLILLLTIGIIISVFFSNKYLKPISRGIEIIKLADMDDTPKTNVLEIDDLIHYLMQYKIDLNKKVQQDKYQISMLEQFVTRTKSLTPAERSVFNYYISGLSAKEIAEAMFLSINTIKTHSKHIFTKLDVSSREELLLYINMLKEIGVELK